MGKFKDMYTEGRNKWDVFTIKKCDQRWSFINTASGKRYYIKLSDNVNDVGKMQQFLSDILAKPANLPKTQGKIDFNDFATKVIGKKKADVYIKSGNWDEIRKKWNLDEQ